MRDNEQNRLLLAGCVDAAPAFSHRLGNECFYRFPLAVARTSGTADILPVLAAERLLPPSLPPGAYLELSGQLRTYSYRTAGGGSRLYVTAYAQSVQPLPRPAMKNDVFLSGALCKAPVYRKTPMQREITDLLVAVERAYRKTDYLPVIAWGGNARLAADRPVGAKLALHGRLQSRDYQKLLPGGQVCTRTAYEVSASSLEFFER